MSDSMTGNMCNYLNPFLIVPSTFNWICSTVSLVSFDALTMNSQASNSRDYTPVRKSETEMGRITNLGERQGMNSVGRQTIPTNDHFWMTDRKLKNLPESIEDYFSHDSVDKILDHLLPDRKREGGIRQGLDISIHTFETLPRSVVSRDNEGLDEDVSDSYSDVDCDVNCNRMREIKAMLANKKVPPQVYNLIVAHEDWEEVHKKIKQTVEGLQPIIRRAMTSNLCHTIGEDRGIKSGIRMTENGDYEQFLAYSGGAEETVWNLDDDDDDYDDNTLSDEYREKSVKLSYSSKSVTTFGAENSKVGYETDYSIFGVVPLSIEEPLSGVALGPMVEDDHSRKMKITGMTDMANLINAYHDYDTRLKESERMINTFIMLESEFLKFLRSPTATAAIRFLEAGNRKILISFEGRDCIDDDFSVERKYINGGIKLLERANFFVRYVSEKARTILVLHDAYRETMKGIQDCFKT